MEFLQELRSAFDSESFGRDCSFHIDKPVGSASISPCGRDIVLASRQGLHIIDLDSPYAPPRDLAHYTPWEVADVQWSPFADRDYWIVSTSNQKALVWNLYMFDKNASVEHVLHGHKRAITDINFSAHHPDILATCAVDSYVHCWDLRRPSKPAMTFCDWFAGATQVKWNRQDSHILASSHDKHLKIWDDRKGAQPLNTIAAHSTKIYGVDWDRLDSQKVTTCSLDQTIKLWNYQQESGEPEKVIHTPFPVWRARHAPFGAGLVALPQRGDHDLHLYDHRHDSEEQYGGITESIHQFSGHLKQVKEFLWRPRGIVTSTIDDREFQLVSWGADQHLRLHEVNAETLSKVGYTKGMQVKRKLNFTRRGATYKTFRDEQIRGEDDDSRDDLPGFNTRSARTAGISRSSMPFNSGYGSGGFMSSVFNKKSFPQKVLDPVSWMQGVKIGKRAVSPSGMPDSVPSLSSPTLRTTPSWDTFESLGEEIASILSKFPKVISEDMDVQRRRITVSLPGPWAAEKLPIQLRCRFEFPSMYPNAAAPIVSVDKTFSVSDETVHQVSSEAKQLANEFLSQQRHSLEAILRYLLGEQSLEESLQWLKKHSTNADTAIGVDLDLSSSSDEDDDGPARYVPPPTNGLESSDSMIAVNNAEYNVPLPKSCGAFWAENGRLVCFFPKKLEKGTSLLDQSIGDALLQNSGKDLFEGFGRLHKAFRQKKTSSTLETLTSSGSDDDYDLISSNSSSASDDEGLPSHHFLPMVPWNGILTGANPEITLEASQKSVGETGQPSTAASRVNMLITIHDFSDILPVREYLARHYHVGGGYESAMHNIAVAKHLGDQDLVDAWIRAWLILRPDTPDQCFSTNGSEEGITGGLRRKHSSLLPKDSAIDLSFDIDVVPTPPFNALPGEWNTQNSRRRWLVQSLLQQYEICGDVQMLAMLTCVLTPSPDSLQWTTSSKAISQGQHLSYYVRASIQDKDYTASVDTPRNISRSDEIRSPLREDLEQDPSGPGSVTSSIGIATSDQSSPLAGSTTPPNYRSFLAPHDSRASVNAGFSTSPEQYRAIQRTNSNLSALTASFPRPFPFSNPAASSPPSSHPKKRPSPTGSFLGPTQSSNAWTPSNWINRAAPIPEDPKNSISDSISDTEEETPGIIATIEPPIWTCMMKNQDQFHYTGQTNVALLDPSQESSSQSWRHAYAQLLHVWNMPLEAAEVLKFNPSPPSSPATNDSAAIPTLFPGDTLEQHAEQSTLSLRPHCQTCSALLPLDGSRKSRKCPTCQHQTLPVPLCIYCDTYIHGMASPCLSCGHTMHLTCRIAYSQHVLADSGADCGGEECVTGCGCICSDYATLEIPVPLTQEKSLLNGGDANPALVPPMSSADGGSGSWSAKAGRGDLGDDTREDNSLPSTMNASVNEQEMAGWERQDQYRERVDFDDDEEDEDDADAYVRLRRSLAGGAMRRASGSLARGLRGSGSQIWRGGGNSDWGKRGS